MFRRPISLWLTLVVSACTSFPSGTTLPAATSTAGTTVVTLSFQHLLPIAPAYGHYQAWAVGQGAPQSIGAFLVGADGSITSVDGHPQATWSVPIASSSLRTVLVTQELPGATASVPSKQIFLQGPVTGAIASLSAPVNPADFLNRTGSYILDNPASKFPGDSNGIWFAKIDNGREVPGLSLDLPPSGWMYAGWVIWRGVVLRTGKFTDAASMDDFYGYSGLNSVSLPVNYPGPPMPGEDFNTNLPPGVDTGRNKPDLAGATVIISVENATLANEEQYPSPIHLFEGTVASPSVPRTTMPLTNVTDHAIPSGTATLQ
jgi:hypothetical protein